jgi:O-antigen biosynthesis protein
MGCDAAVYIRQILRDFGFTVRAAREVTKMIVRAAKGTRSGGRIRGINRRPEYDFSMSVPFGFVDDSTPPPHLRIAGVCHMFYPELSVEFRTAFRQIPGRVDVVLSTDTVAKQQEIALAFAGWEKGTVDVRVVVNRGRDIAPKLTAYRDILDRYDLILFVHSKRTVRTRDDGSLWDQGEEWRRHLLHNLAGSPEIVASILEAFRNDPRLGLIFPQHWEPVRPYVDWQEVFRAARDLGGRMGIRLTPGHVIDFPSGSMFWARPAALAPITNLGLRAEDFPEETGQQEGTLAHIIERLFLFICEAAGYRWAKVCDVSTTLHPHTVIPIGTIADLEAFHRRRGFRLTALGPRLQRVRKKSD